VVVLPLLRHRDDRFAQERHGLVGTSGPAGIALAQEDRPEPVRDVEVRIQRRGEVQQRVEQLVLRPGNRAGQPIAAIMLERADPVDVGGQRIEAEHDPLERLAGSDVEDPLLFLRRPGIPAIAQHLQRDRRPQRDARRQADEEVAGAQLHLKSRREKMNVATSRSAAM
jgi:hypothetical protein